MHRKWLFIIGVLLIVLPLGIQWWDKKNQENVVLTHWEQVETLQEYDIQNCMEEAKEYNRRLFQKLELQEVKYENVLNLSNDGIMGSIEIPKISLNLPIYHGTSEEVLSKGIGHLKESSFPVGGENVHSILTGHRGLPSAQLFTRLDELEQEDIFFVRVYNEVLTYRVKDIKVIEPEDIEVLEIQEGKDMVSLITCTPYGLNTHRLVVTGEREMEENIKISEEAVVSYVSKRDFLILLLPCVFLSIAVVKTFREKGGSR